MHKLIEHPAILAKRTELVLGNDENCSCTLHVDTDLVLTPDAPCYDKRAVVSLVETVNAYRLRHAVSKVVFHELD